MRERRPERARHEVFLAVKAGPDDLGSRPLAVPFISPDIVVGADGRPRTRIWNLGRREVEGVVTEFYTVPAGLPVTVENVQLLGMGNPAIIAAGQAVIVGCNEVWRRMSHADLLLVMAFHPELDPVKVPYDAQRDRHVGQMNYPWSGIYEGHIGGDPRRARVEVKAANQGLFRVRLFEEMAGRFARFPRCDRLMKPNRHSFRWLEVEGDRKLIYDLTLLENDRLALTVEGRSLEQPDGPVEKQTGLVERVIRP